MVPVTPASVRHQRLVGFLHALLSEYVRTRDLGEVLGAPFGVRLPEPLRRAREPDVIFVRKDRLPLLRATFFDGAPDLVVEVTSPDSLSRDRGEKFVAYEQAGVGPSPGCPRAGPGRLTAPVLRVRVLVLAVLAEVIGRGQDQHARCPPAVEGAEVRHVAREDMGGTCGRCGHRDRLVFLGQGQGARQVRGGSGTSSTARTSWSRRSTWSGVERLRRASSIT